MDFFLPIFRLFLLCLILLVSACATRPIAPTAQSNPPIAINLQHLAKLNTIKKFSIKAKYLLPGMIGIEMFLAIQNYSWDIMGHFAHLGGAIMGAFLVKGLNWERR